MSDFVLWGSHPLYAQGEPIKLASGTDAECFAELTTRAYQSPEWLTAIYRAGAAPLGLRIQAAARVPDPRELLSRYIASQLGRVR